MTARTVETTRSGGRHRSREVALQVLYAADLGAGAEDGFAAAEESFERVAENFDLPEGARIFAKELVCGVVERREELDTLLAAHATNWRVSRMAAIDRNVLRLGSYELRYTETPVSVVLDQAIELARRFGAEPSPAFVNGVLDAVARDVRDPDAARAGGGAS